MRLARGSLWIVTREPLESLLRGAGVEDASTISANATIRPPTLGVATDKTIAAPKAGHPYSLPRLSVDLRESAATDGRPISRSVDLEVLRLLGEGGMGRVFLARQHSLERDVAIKTGKAVSAADRSVILREGVVMGRLEHPGIVPVHALGVDHTGNPVMVMKRVEGVGWNVLRSDPAHPGWDGWDGDAGSRLRGHLQILSHVCNAVHFAHSRGIVHRDIKPENVLIGRFGDVYLMDWGVAAEIGQMEALLCGTPAYMAPEMVEVGGVIDERTDVYLLGATLHEILTGAPRHLAENLVAALEAAERSEPHDYPDHVPVELGRLANAACHRDRDERPRSAQVFRDAIARHAQHSESVALGAEAIGRLSRLEWLLATPKPSDEQRREIDRLLVEARFGLEQALAQWSDNVRAREALGRLEEIVEAKLARTAELERQARERDPRIAALPRALGITMVAALGVISAIIAVAVVDRPTPRQLLLLPIVIAIAIAGGCFAFRRVLLATSFNRQAIALVFLGLALMFVGRMLGLFTDIEPAQHFGRDAFVWASVLGMGAITLLRWLGWLAAVFAAGGAACTLYPEHGLTAFAGSTMLVFVAGAVLAWRTGPGLRS